MVGMNPFLMHPAVVQARALAETVATVRDGRRRREHDGGRRLFRRKRRARDVGALNEFSD
jgi:hypothetical protein